MIFYLILFFLSLIFLVIYFKIKSSILASILLIIIGLIITIDWFFNNNKKIYSHECLIGKIKKVNGLFYNSCFDFWHILHILLYILIGLLFPNNYFIILIISIIWELYEHFMFKYVVKKVKCKDFICLRFEDILLNLIGYYIGNVIYQIIIRNNNNSLISK